MGGTGNYGNRDGAIKLLLLSPDLEERKQGMVRLDREMRKPVTAYLLSLARGKKKTVYTPLLQRDVPKEIWRDTMASVWKNVEENKFKADGSLFSYLVTIALRRAADRWRQRKKIGGCAGPAPFAVTMPVQDNGLLEIIEQFANTRPEKDQVALRLDVTLALANNGEWETAEIFTIELNTIRLAREWGIMTVEAVRAWRVRIRRKLREFQGGDHD